MRRVRSLDLVHHHFGIDRGTRRLPAGRAGPPNATAQQSRRPRKRRAAIALAAPVDENAIVVTGLRRASSRRGTSSATAYQIVDAIVAEDIGKLPDITVSDTAARIPGHPGRAQRRRSEPRAASRPRPHLLYDDLQRPRNLYRGNSLGRASGLSRRRDLRGRGVQDLDRESGRAGPRGPDQRPFPPPVRLQGIRGRGLRLGRVGQPGSRLQAARPDPGHRPLARGRRRDGRADQLLLHPASLSGLDPPPRLLHRRPRRRPFARLPEIRYNGGDRWRPSVNGALQWRPSPDLEFYAEGLWQGYREELTDRLWQQPLWGGSELFEPGRRGRPDHQRHGNRSGAAAAVSRPRASRARPSARPTPISSRSAAATTLARCGLPATSLEPTAPSSCAPRASIIRSTPTISRSTGSPDGPADPGPRSTLSDWISPIRRFTIIAASSRII